MKTSNKNIFNTLSYIALVIIAILIVLENFLGLRGTVLNVLKTVKNLFILIVVGFSAYNFTSGKAKWVTIVFWIAVIVFIVATILMWVF